MAISPVAGTIYANQVAPQASVIQADQQAKIDMQNAMAAALANEKEKEITEVRATEETYHVDPDNEHEKERSKEEQERKKSSDDEQDLAEDFFEEGQILADDESQNEPEIVANQADLAQKKEQILRYEHAELLSAKELEERLENIRQKEEEQNEDEDKPAFLNLSV